MKCEAIPVATFIYSDQPSDVKEAKTNDLQDNNYLKEKK